MVRYWCLTPSEAAQLPQGDARRKEIISKVCFGRQKTPTHRHRVVRRSRSVIVFTKLKSHRLVGLVVKESASRAEDLGFESRLRRDFFGVESYRILCCWGTTVDFTTSFLHSSRFSAFRSSMSHTSDFKIGTPVATLSVALCYRVSAGTGLPGVSIL